MLGLIVCAATLAANPPDTSKPPETYAEARARAGRSPEEQVRLALWCETRGLSSERLHHLSLAVLADPRHAVARGLMGMVERDGRWLRPESVAERLKPDPTLAGYEGRRTKAPDTLEGHLALGRWAAEHGLADQARAHFTVVTRIEPDHAEARKYLGFLRRDGRWVSAGQVAAENAEGATQRLADLKWRPYLGECRRLLTIPARRIEAEAKLLTVSDPRAVPSIGRVFATTEALQPVAVRLLGQVDSPGSTKALAYLSVYGISPKARRAAAETLRHRDPREYAEPLIALLAEAIRYEIKHVAGIAEPGELLVEGRRTNVRRVYEAPNPFKPDDTLGQNEAGQPVVIRRVEPGVGASILVSSLLGQAERPVAQPTGSSGLASRREVDEVRRIAEADSAFHNLNGLNLEIRFGDRAEIPLAQMAGEVRRSMAEAEAKIRADARLLEDNNVADRLANGRVADVLNAATGQALAPDRRAWQGWFVEQVGYNATSESWTDRPAVDEPVSVAYRPPALPENSTRQVVGYSYRYPDCFAAGTPVQTIAGPRPIDSIQVGDRVLTQSVVDGSLGYRPVLAAHHNPAMATTRIRLAGGPVVSSKGHRYWVAGRGWVMARDLKPGDPIRTLGGVVRVESVEPDAVQLVYNLDVAEAADYFAGPVAALVHDNTLPDPRLVPFDRDGGR